MRTKNLHLVVFLFFSNQLLSQDTLVYNQSVAIHVKNGGYLRYKEKPAGINLDYSTFPVFEWKIRNGNKEGLVETGIPIELYNKKNVSALVYAQRDNGINLKWHKDAPGTNPKDWIIHGAPNSGNRTVLLKNNKKFRDGKKDFYLKFGIRDPSPFPSPTTLTASLVWGSDARDKNIQFVNNKVRPSEIISDGAVWKFKNPRVSWMHWNTFSTAFDLGFFDEDSRNLVTYAIFGFAASRLGSKGTCFGMCLSSAFAAERNISHFPYFGRVKEPIWDNYSSNTANLQKAINVFHWKQLSTGFVDGWFDSITDSYVSIAEQIKRDIDNDKFGLICIYDKIPGNGHVLMPYKVIKTGTKYEIYVYDPNRPPAQVDQVPKVSYPPLTITGPESFTYLMANGEWKGDMCYLPYKRSSSYTNLFNSLLDIAYVLLSEGAELEQVTEGNTKKLFNINSNNSVQNVDYSENGLGKSLYRFIPLSNTESDERDIFEEFPTPPDSSNDKIISEIISNTTKDFGKNSTLYLVRHKDLKDIALRIKSNGQNPIKVSIGNKSEIATFKLPAKANVGSSNNSSTITIANFSNLKDRLSLRQQSTSIATSEITFGFINKNKQLEFQSVKLPSEAIVLDIKVNKNNQLNIKVPNTSNQNFTVSKLIIDKNGKREVTNAQMMLQD